MGDKYTGDQCTWEPIGCSEGGGWLPSRSTCWLNTISQGGEEGPKWKGEGSGKSICQGGELERRAHSLERKAARAETQRQAGPYPDGAQGYTGELRLNPGM